MLAIVKATSLFMQTCVSTHVRRPRIKNRKQIKRSHACRYSSAKLTYCAAVY